MPPVIIATDTLPSTTRLPYTIAGCSEHSGQYVAENIIVDSPKDQSSRWSGAHQSAGARQWILLRLDKPSVLTSITFGKYHKQHPCNTKEFQVYAGPSEASMVEAHQGSLRNDAAPETFALRHTNAAGVPFPTRFVKVVPLSAHGTSFHTSIWHVTLSGISDDAHVARVSAAYDQFRETTAMRHILKFLRQRRLLPPDSSLFGALDTSAVLEDPLVTELHNTLVLSGDFERAERVLTKLAHAGLFSVHLRARAPRAIWTRVLGTDADGDVPCARGGHAMCLAPDDDGADTALFLYGGFTGTASLADLWRYTLRTDTWKRLVDGANDGSDPCARSCHKITWDAHDGCLYLLGGLGEEDARKAEDGVHGLQGDEGVEAAERGAGASAVATTDGPPCEVWRYHTRGSRTGHWERLSGDTADEHGPPVLFDHQVALDPATRTLYMYGGRVLGGTRGGAVRYSGLHACDLRTGKWTELPPARPSGSALPIPARYGHAMVLDSRARSLFVVGGQQDDKPLSDLWSYDLDTHVPAELSHQIGTMSDPPWFATRAVADTALGELYLFSGLAREQRQMVVPTEPACWVYRYGGAADASRGTWTKILAAPATKNKPDAISALSEDEDEDEESPQARYAHQVLYDEQSQTVYMHGGNAGRVLREASQEDEPEERRLDDFWNMKLERPAPEEVVRKATFEVRKQQFREMCEGTSPVRALQFLRADVYAMVDHSDADEAGAFRALLAHLLAAPPSSPPPDTSDMAPSGEVNTSEADAIEEGDGSVTRLGAAPEGGGVSEDVFRQRTEVFEALLEFVNPEAREPRTDLLDLIVREG